jgi:hypothetical protein
MKPSGDAERPAAANRARWMVLKSAGSLGERLRNMSNRDLCIVLALVLALIFTNNVFHFSQYRINKVFDQTSEGLVVGRIARSASEGINSRGGAIGFNFDLNSPRDTWEAYSQQLHYFEHPELIKGDETGWGPYISHVALQGYFFSAIDKIDPLPRHYRIGLYHFLSALICAAAYMWVAFIVRERFGLAAFAGFVACAAFEPMFTALAPNLYWAAGLWFVPMALAMRIVEAGTGRRRALAIVLTGGGVFAKALCGYEFISAVIVAAMVGCLMNNREGASAVFRNLIDMAWVWVAGIAGFFLAILLHGYKFTFATILARAVDRTTAGASQLDEGLLLGQFASVSSVLRTYLRSNDYTQIRNFGLLFAVLGVVAVIAFLDNRFAWFMNDDRRKLRTLAFAYFVSFAGPLSWLIIAKAHSFVHTPIDFIVWYIPTVPVGAAMALRAVEEVIDNKWKWRILFPRSLLTILIPASLAMLLIVIAVLDRKVDDKGSWVLEAHAHGTAVFTDPDIGVDLRMGDNWFTVEYACDRTTPTDIFVLRAFNGEAMTNYDFRLVDRLVSTPLNRKCYYAQSRSRWPFTRLEFGLNSDRRSVWHREKTFTVRDTFSPEPATDATWDHGVLRLTRRTLLLKKADCLDLWIQVGDALEFAVSGRRTVSKIEYVDPDARVSFDSAPIASEDVAAPIKVFREP